MFAEAVSTIYSTIASTTMPLPTYPWDFQGQRVAAPYLMMMVRFLRGKQVIDYSRNKSLEGLLIFSHFYPTGRGQTPATTVATALDVIFQDKKLGNLQFYASSLSDLGQDPSDRTLTRTDYSIPFKFYGA